MPNLCKKEKGNTKNFNLKTMKNLYHKIFFKKFQKNFQKKFLIQKKIRIFFKLKFFTFFFSFLQRLGMNIKCPNVGYLKSISSRQYV